MQYCACIRKIVRTPPSVKHYIAWLVLTPTVYHSRPLQGNSMDQFETAAQSAGAADSLSEAPRNQVLQALGERVRSLRSRRGMTRRALAAAADVSERHLANLEYGTGNVSVLVLHHIAQDRKSTRLNSSHSQISYAVFCLKKKKRVQERTVA